MAFGNFIATSTTSISDLTNGYHQTESISAAKSNGRIRRRRSQRRKRRKRPRSQRRQFRKKDRKDHQISATTQSFLRRRHLTHGPVCVPCLYPHDNALTFVEFVENQSARKSESVGPDGATPARGSVEPSATPGAAEDAEVEDKEEEEKKEPIAFSREDEIEKLRTSGSMTQNPTEVSRIRNISKVQMGKFDLFPWYFAPYPESFNQEEVIFICEFCLSYYGDEFSFTRHRRKCTLQHPPGNEIYRDDSVSFFEIDGRRQRTWCRNLCLLSKMFLDHKTLFYDVDPFLFYVMTTRTAQGFHVMGYFSKEKESADGYNVACILTLPQYQRKGYGRLLIQFSYELSRIEGKLGSPEKPLSDLGLLSYRQYWSENILDVLLGYHERGEKVTIEAISTTLAMTTQDVEHTLQAMKMQIYHKSDHKIVIPEKLVQQREKQMQKVRRHIDPERIQWKPPVFTASSRTWGW